MTLACQKDSYLKSLKSKVKTCIEASVEEEVNGTKVKIDGFEIVLDDTVIFPEGGGQPSDHGKINGIPVLKIYKRGTEVVHFIEKEVICGDEVLIEVNWERRWDHMQQHSGQHLLSAVAESLFGFETTAWNLGDKISFIELNTPDISMEQIAEMEKIANEKIRDSIAIYPRLIEDRNNPEVKEIKCRGLPERHEGPIRVVTIEGIDTNLCCGTHVNNLSHLQAIKLLNMEKGKKGKVNLIFLVGERILGYVSKLHAREKAFVLLLKGHPDDHVCLLQKIKNSLKVAEKNSITLLRDVALLEGEKLKRMNPKPRYVAVHKKEGDNEFMNILANCVGQEIFLLLTTGDEKGSGLFLLSGKPEDVQILGPRVAELLQGKGAGKGSKFQGRGTSFWKRGEVEEVIRNHFSVHKSPSGETAT